MVDVRNQLGVEVEWPLTIRLMMALAKELHPDIRQTYVAFSLPFFFEVRFLPNCSG